MRTYRLTDLSGDWFGVSWDALKLSADLQQRPKVRCVASSRLNMGTDAGCLQVKRTPSKLVSPDRLDSLPWSATIGTRFAAFAPPMALGCKTPRKTTERSQGNM